MYLLEAARGANQAQPGAYEPVNQAVSSGGIETSPHPARPNLIVDYGRGGPIWTHEDVDESLSWLSVELGPAQKSSQGEFQDERR